MTTNNKTLIKSSNNDKFLKIIEQELTLRGFSKKTVSSYLIYNKHFIDWAKIHPNEVKQTDIKNYIISLKNKGYTHATINLAIASLRFYYIKIKKRRFTTIKSMKKQDRFTGVVTKENILKVIDNTLNPKHKLLIELMYSSGIRVSEAIKVKYEDFNIEQNTVLIKCGKGQKDRIAILSEKFKLDFLLYKMNNKILNDQDYLFPGRTGHITTRTAQELISQLFKKYCKIHVHPHMLRASFATHLFENKVDSHIIKKFMGHKNLKTTEGYIKYANINPTGIKSPIDI